MCQLVVLFDYGLRKKCNPMSGLEETKPPLFIVVHDDVNVADPIPSNESLLRVPGLEDYVKTNYHVARRIGRYVIHERVDAPPAPILGEEHDH